MADLLILGKGLLVVPGDWFLARVSGEAGGWLTGLALCALGVLSLPYRMRRQLMTCALDALLARTRSTASSRAAAFRLRRLYLPSMLWRFVTYVVIVCLLGTDPRFDFFTLHAQCTIPWNPSTPTTRVTQFSYDFDGRLTQMNAPEGVINYTYDLPTGRLTSTCTANSQVAYAYDQLGRLGTVRVLERNGIVLTNAEVTTYKYDKVGNRSTVTLPNGVTSTYLYDSLNRLTNLVHATATNILASYSYKLDRTGRRTNAVEVLLQEGSAGYLTNTLTWQYDGMYRLTNEISACSHAAGQYTNAYQYDKVGNRLKKIPIIGSTNYTTASSFNTNDELLVETSIQNGVTNGATGYAYDAIGSLTSKTNATGSISYTYNLANKLSSVAASGIATAFCYNDQGIRVGSSTSSSTNYFLVDANNHTGYQQVLEDLPNPGGTPTMSYVIGDDVLAQCGTTGSAPSYFLPDGHGSNRQLVSTATGLASHYTYDAYGVTCGTSTTPATTTKLYCGEQWDSTLGMYNLRARYYDPANGRFNQRDVFAGNNFDPQSLHKYAYAGGDPVNNSDPRGLFGMTEILIASFIAATVSALVNAVIAKVTGGVWWEGLIKGFISGFVTTFLLLGVQFADPGRCAAVGAAAGQGIVEIIEYFRNPGTAVLWQVIVRMAISIGVAWIMGAAFGQQLASVGNDSALIAKIFADQQIRESIDTLTIELGKAGFKSLTTASLGAVPTVIAKFAFLAVEKVPQIIEDYIRQWNQ